MMGKLSMWCGILSLLCMLLLHFVSSEFNPAFRMISEYALGKNKWLLTSFFALWALSGIFLSVGLFDVVTSRWAVFGVILLLISSAGALLGALFDVKHKLHGLAFGLGVPTLPVAALIISYHLMKMDAFAQNKMALMFTSHLTWISLILMSVTMFVLFAGLKKVGIEMGRDSQFMEVVPEGVVAVNGYANRLLVFSYVLWIVVAGKILSNAHQLN